MAWTKALSVFSCDVPFLPGLVHSRVTVRIFGGPISAFSCATATAPSANKHVPNISPIGFIGNLLCGFEKQPPFYADLVFWQRLPWQGSVGPTTRYSMQTKTHIGLSAPTIPHSINREGRARRARIVACNGWEYTGSQFPRGG